MSDPNLFEWSLVLGSCVETASIRAGLMFNDRLTVTAVVELWKTAEHWEGEDLRRRGLDCFDLGAQSTHAARASALAAAGWLAFALAIPFGAHCNGVEPVDALGLCIDRCCEVAKLTGHSPQSIGKFVNAMMIERKQWV